MKLKNTWYKNTVEMIFRNLPVVLFFVVHFPCQAQEAREIVEMADKKLQGNSSTSDMIMKIVRPDWSREIRMKAWSLGKEHSIVLIVSPARDKGAAFLKREKEIWNWQPSINRVIKLPPSMMMQSWMGSDFTNDDLVKESSIVRDYTHTLVGDTIIENRPAHMIEMIPKPEAAVVWGRVVIYITKEDYLQLMVRYYDEDEFLINTMYLSDIREIGGRVIPTKLDMVPADNPNQRTEIIYMNMEFEVPMEESFFSIQNMKRVR